jgi:adsorption protein B
VTIAAIVSGMANELALFAAAGYLLFAVDDLLVDVIYFTRRLWRSATVYSRFQRAFARQLAPPDEPGWIAIFVPAWDEAPVIGHMLRATLARVEHEDYRILVGYYRNDPATAAAIASARDPRIIAVALPVNGPTTKADCLNHLYAALIDAEAAGIMYQLHQRKARPLSPNPIHSPAWTMVIPSLFRAYCGSAANWSAKSRRCAPSWASNWRRLIISTL